MTEPTPSPDSATVTLRINGTPVEVAKGATVLEAARQAKIAIPTLCHLEGQPGFSSCMLCTVEDKAGGKTFPSCAIEATPGMEIETDTERLIEKRRGLLELIMSDHSGDCEAPCELVCPASIPIPEIIRHLRNDRPDKAAELLRERVPLGGVLERICTAPCEKGCRRAKVDAGVSIRAVCRYAADLPYEASNDAPPPRTGEPLGRVGILGAGPTGLAAAWHLARAGVEVTLVDEREEPGGMLRQEVPESKLPKAALEREIDEVRRLGVRFEMGVRVGRDIDFASWRSQFDAVALCVGQISDPDSPSPKLKKWDPHPSPLHPDAAAECFGVDMAPGGIKIDRATLQTSLEDVFAGGDAAKFMRLAVRAVGDGRTLAHSILHRLREGTPAAPPRPFNCTMGRLGPEQLAEYAKRGSSEGRVDIEEDPAAPLPKEEILREAARCLSCDCAARHACDLRDHCDAYDVKSRRFVPPEPIPYHSDETHPEIEIERGKCIRCSICVRLSDLKEEPVGLAALGRGLAKHPGPPTGKTWADALQKEPLDYCKKCPTGAIALKRG